MRRNESSFPKPYNVGLRGETRHFGLNTVTLTLQNMYINHFANINNAFSIIFVLLSISGIRPSMYRAAYTSHYLALPITVQSM